MQAFRGFLLQLILYRYVQLTDSFGMVNLNNQHIYVRGDSEYMTIVTNTTFTNLTSYEKLLRKTLGIKLNKLEPPNELLRLELEKKHAVVKT